MEYIYELNEYNNAPGGDTFSPRASIKFTSPAKTINFIKTDIFYGMCFVYEKTEYEDYFNSTNWEVELPEKVCEFTVDINSEEKDFRFI